jgi:hypothetical protein
VIVGVAGTVKPAGNAMVSVSPAASAPVAEAVKSTVQFALVLAARVDAENAAPVTLVAAAMTTFEAGLAVAVSREVFTVKLVLSSDPADGFVRPTSVRVVAAEFETVHVPALSARVIVAVWPLAVAVAEQFVKPLVRLTVGVAGTVKPELKAAVIVSPAASAPLALVVNPTCQVECAPPVWGVPLNETALGAVAALIVTAAAGLTATVSVLVLTLQFVAAIAPAPGFVRNLIVRFPDVELACVHVPPLSASVMVAVVPEPTPDAEQFV